MVRGLSPGGRRIRTLGPRSSDAERVVAATTEIVTRLTRRWREMDSNLRFPNRSALVFRDNSPAAHDDLTVSRQGTESWNPSPSSGESGANLIFGDESHRKYPQAQQPTEELMANLLPCSGDCICGCQRRKCWRNRRVSSVSQIDATNDFVHQFCTSRLETRVLIQG
jgi:hypothetical protein